jgi:hypothetical protein
MVCAAPAFALTGGTARKLCESLSNSVEIGTTTIAAAAE